MNAIIQAPTYRTMMRYTWYAANLITSQTSLQCNQVAFSAEKLQNANVSSTRSLYVHGVAYFYFHCSCDEYHPESCKPVTLVKAKKAGITGFQTTPGSYIVIQQDIYRTGKVIKR
jgi:hypothetical protein